MKIFAFLCFSTLLMWMVGSPIENAVAFSVIMLPAGYFINWLFDDA